MKNFDSRTYNIEDFREWSERGQLILNPKFQRREVWSQSAKSFLIDTIVRGKPIPKIFIRQNIDPNSKKSMREVVDGQQRLSAILAYLKDGFPISRIHNEKYGGCHYSELPSNVQTEFLKYEIAADLLINLPDSEVLEIFARLNSYTIVLNNQEKLNAKYNGAFKQTVYQLGFEFVDFYLNNCILSDRQVSRMTEAELTSELLIAMIAGIQSRKVVEQYYKQYDDKFSNHDLLTQRFRKIIDIIGSVYGKSLVNSNFSRVHMFYSLVIAFYDIFYGLPNTKYKTKKYDESLNSKIRSTLDDIDSLWNMDEVPTRSKGFFEATRRGTTDQRARLIRHTYIVDALMTVL